MKIGEDHGGYCGGRVFSFCKVKFVDTVGRIPGFSYSKLFLFLSMYNTFIVL